MRTFNPESEHDVEESQRLKASEWMLKQLAFNPEYPYWGPHEDYMWKGDGKGAGWDSSVITESWADFGPWKLDELNECANFYFYVDRDRVACPEQGGDCQGYNPETKKISDAFYAHHLPYGSIEHDLVRWCDKITQDEVEALAAAHRLNGFKLHRWDDTQKDWVRTDNPIPTAEEINAQNRAGARFMGHDAINRCILIKARAKRLGVWGQCPKCEGHGEVFTSPTARLGLVLWWLHPRKGASRGIDIKNVTQQDLPKVYAFLKEAAVRNAARFSSIP